MVGRLSTLEKKLWKQVEIGFAFYKSRIVMSLFNLPSIYEFCTFRRANVIKRPVTSEREYLIGLVSVCWIKWISMQSFHDVAFVDVEFKASFEFLEQASSAAKYGMSETEIEVNDKEL